MLWAVHGGADLDESSDDGNSAGSERGITPTRADATMRPTMSLLPRVLSIRLGGWLDLGVPVRHALCEADGRRAVAGLSEHLLKGHISPDEAVRAYSTACDDCEKDLWNKIKRMMWERVVRYKRLGSCAN